MRFSPFQVIPMPKSRESWLKSRSAYIGASDIGGIILDADSQPLHPYKSPHEVWLEKTGRKVFEGNERTDMGLLLEPTIVQLFKSRNPGIRVKATGTHYGEKPHHAANPDRLILGRVSQCLGTPLIVPDTNGIKAILQLKSAGFYSAKDFGVEGTDEVPLWYAAQVQWEMYCTGADLCVLALLYDTHLYHQFLIWRDETLINQLKGWADSFWAKYMATDHEPPMTGHGKDREWLNGAWEPKNNEGRIYMPQELEADIDAIVLELPRMERFQQIIEGRKNRIKAAMGESALMDTPYGLITWKADKNGRRSLNLKGIAAPETAQGAA